VGKLIDSLRAIAFDLDGTLIDSAPDLAAALNAMLEALGMHPVPEKRVPALIGGGVEQLVSRALVESARTTRAPTVEPANAQRLFNYFYGRQLFQRSRVYPGVYEALREFRDRGITLCCITNKSAAFTKPLLKRAELHNYLRFTLCAGRVTDRKPNPKLLLKACSRLNVAPGEMLYVGDAVTDILAARAAGCPIVAVSYGYGRDLKAAEPHAVIPKLTEISELPGHSIPLDLRH